MTYFILFLCRNDTEATVLAVQGTHSGVLSFSTNFSRPSVVNVRVACNGTTAQVNILVLPGTPHHLLSSFLSPHSLTFLFINFYQGGPHRIPPVTFPRYGRNYIVINWQLDNSTNYGASQLYFSPNQTTWTNFTISPNISRYPFGLLFLQIDFILFYYYIFQNFL